MEGIRSAVILAGGAGRRIGGDKAAMEFLGRTMIERVVDRVRDVALDVVVVVRDEPQRRRIQRLVPDARVVCDQVSGYGPVAGLVAGMEAARGDWSLAAGCDLPFISPGVFDTLFRLVEGHDAAVPKREDGVLETLHAVYRSGPMAEACRRAVLGGERRIVVPLETLRVNRVPVDRLRSADPRLLSFFNVNTKEDLREASRVWEASQMYPWSRLYTR